MKIDGTVKTIINVPMRTPYPIETAKGIKNCACSDVSIIKG
jgi:hypothetical protein